MKEKIFILPLLLTLVWASGCSSYDTKAVVPQPLPLVAPYPAAAPEEEPGKERAPAASVPGPDSTLTLDRALSLALTRNPGLAAFSLEVRAREARALQASLAPNPDFSIEVENFGGKGTFSGFDGSETTISLGQLMELGGKRGKRTRVAALDGDLATRPGGSTSSPRSSNPSRPCWCSRNARNSTRNSSISPCGSSPR